MADSGSNDSKSDVDKSKYELLIKTEFQNILYGLANVNKNLLAVNEKIEEVDHKMVKVNAALFEFQNSNVNS